MAYEFKDADLSSMGKLVSVKSGEISNLNYEISQGVLLFQEEILPQKIAILQSRYCFKQDVKLHGKGFEDLLEIQFNLSNNGIGFQDFKNHNSVSFAKAANMIFLNKEDNFASIDFQKEINYNTFDIHLPLNYLESYYGITSSMDSFIDNINNKRSSFFLSEPLYISPAISTILLSIQNNSYEGLTRKIYLESKAHELIALLCEGFDKADTRINTLQKHDREAIYMAAELIIQNLDQPFTIVELAKRVGINQTKLKIGFHLVFNNTIFGYLQDIRMQQAKTYLLDTNLSIQEIGFLVGYQNSANFSNAFKKIHGYSPIKLRLKSSACAHLLID
jgi:AraC family transcriptional regulator, transcriptional activator of the genes for pyochelin and ferripyochelin receptors